MKLYKMVKKDNKQRLFEVMQKIDPTFKPKLNEGWNTVKNDAGEPMGTEYQPDAFDPQDEPERDDGPQYKQGIGNFNSIDWHALYERLQINYNVVTGKPGYKDAIAYNYGDLTDYDGMLSSEELQHLEDFDLVEKMGAFPVIGENFGDEKSFYNKAKEIWNQETPKNQSGNDSEAPYLRGREPES